MQRRRFLAAIPATAGLFTAGCLETPAFESTDREVSWQSFQVDAGNTGFTNASGPDGIPFVQWRSSTWGAPSNPVVVDDVVFFGTGLRHEQLLAVDIESGEVLWEDDIDGDVNQALAYHNGLIITGDRTIEARDIETGEVEWSDHIRCRTGFAIDGDTLAFGASVGDDLRVLEASTGEERWSDDTFTRRTPAIYEDSLLIPTMDGVQALDIADGATLWTSPFDARVESPPTVDDGLVSVVTQTGLHVASADDGDQWWSVEGRFRDSSPAVDGEVVIVSGRPADEDAMGIWCYGHDDGEEQWHVEVGDTTPAHPVIANDTVYVATRDNRLFAVDRTSGEERWSMTFEWDLGTPTIIDDRLFVTVGGRLYAIDGDEQITSGESQWKDLVDTPGLPDEVGATPSQSDFYFGSHGYDVDGMATVEVADDAPFSFDVTVTGDTVSVAEDVLITFTFRNEGEEKLNVLSGPPGPFGVLNLEPTDEDDPWITPWQPGYDSGHVWWSPLHGMRGINSILLSTPVEPGETIEIDHELSLSTNGIRPGTYSFERSYTVKDGNDADRSWSMDTEIVIEIEQPAAENGETIYDIEVIDTDEAPQEFMGSFEVSAVEPITESHSGMLELTINNVEGERGSVSTPGAWPFAGYVGQAEDGTRIVLLEEQTYAPGLIDKRTVDETMHWQPTHLPNKHHRRGRGSRAFDADEVATQRYVVLAHPENTGPIGGKTYVFEQGYADNDTEFTWQFTVAID